MGYDQIVYFIYGAPVPENSDDKMGEYEVCSFPNEGDNYGHDVDGNTVKEVPMYLILSIKSYNIHRNYNPLLIQDPPTSPSDEDVRKFKEVLEKNKIPTEKYGLYVTFSEG